MKKLGFFILLIFCVGSTYSQIVLKYESHAFKADAHNPMSLCSYQEPGQGGSDVLWDFSDLRFKKSFEGYIHKIEHSDNGNLFPKSNIELSEFSSRFYFKISEDRMEQYGFSSGDGRTMVHYTTPFVKLKFPFTYNDAFSGHIAGTSSYGGNIGSTIEGSYFVEADAYGTLILPGNTIYENTLRIRTVKEYINKYTSADQEVYIITYRWYNEAHRYPLLVLTKYTTKSGQSEIVNYQAAYNTNALKSVQRFYSEDIELYPNPTMKDLNVRINALSEGVYQFDIYDSSGKLMRSFSKVTSAVGLHDFDLSNKISGLKPASYVLVISNKDTKISKKFVLTE